MTRNEARMKLGQAPVEDAAANALTVTTGAGAAPLVDAPAEDIAKAYDPNQPRDWHGRWTTGAGIPQGSAQERDGSDARLMNAGLDNVISDGLIEAAGRSGRGRGGGRGARAIEEILDSLRRMLREFEEEYVPRPSQKDPSSPRRPVQEEPAEKPSQTPNPSETKPETRRFANDEWANESNPEAKRLGTDPARNKFSAREAITGRRLEEKLGERLTRDPTGDFEWYIEKGGKRTFYDAMGNFDPKYYSAKSFKESIDSHLLKKDAITVIDMTGFSEQQITEISEYISRLPTEAKRRIITLGF